VAKSASAGTAKTTKTTVKKAIPAKAESAATSKASSLAKVEAAARAAAASGAKATKSAAATKTAGGGATASKAVAKAGGTIQATRTAAAKASAAKKEDASQASTGAKSSAAVAKSTSAKAAAKPAPKPASTAKPATTAKATPKAAPASKPAATAKAAAAKPVPAAKSAATAEPAPKARATVPLWKAKPWFASYSSEMPHEIPPLAFPSIGELLVDSCRKYAARPAFSCMGKSLSYAELDRLSASFGAFLQAKGLKKGARVAIMMPNILQNPVAMMGTLRAGFTVVNVNPLYTPRELEHQLNDSGAEAIVILENFATTLQAVVARTKVRVVVVASMGDLMGLKGLIVNLVVRKVKKMVPAWSLPGHIPFNAAVRAGRDSTLQKVSVSPDDVAFLQYTGGTTGVSKGATLLHRNVLANVAQNALWVEDAYRIKPKPANLNYVCALPLYHIFALTVNALMGMQQGGHNILIPNPRDIPAFAKELGKQPFHIFPGLNTLFNALLNNDDFRKLDFKPLILTLGGGMAVQKAVADRWLEVTGCSITEGYGLSETSPVATANLFSSKEFTATIGVPLPSTEIAIRDDDGNDLPAREVGEICIRGPQVMAGYWNRDDETAKVMTKDGFFRSGDMGFMDEKGYVKIVDRKKDMILVSGFNVYPNELEDVVARMPGVLEVAAIGVPDEHSGEAPKLFIVKKDPALTEEAVRAYCKENLTGYKRPKHVEFRKELPKTPVGKILRRELRG